MSWRILVVGVNHAPEGRERLRYAEESAQSLTTWLKSHLNPRLCEFRTLAPPSRQEADDALAWLAKATNRLLVWTGHMEPRRPAHYLVTADTSSYDDFSRMISLTSLEEQLATGESGATTVVALDACFGGTINPPKLTHGGVSGMSIALASTLPDQWAPTHGRDSGLVAVLLSVLNRVSDEASRQARRTLNLKQVCDQVLAGLHQNGYEATIGIDQQGSDLSPLPLAHVHSYERPRRLSSLEQALGFATQAFRDYLNRAVVGGVDVMYFLGYDPWDGCLVYDGLVPGSVEQMLLDSIRVVFLERDRLRSRFAEYRDSDTKLGPAGKCFRNALVAAFGEFQKEANKAQGGASASRPPAAEMPQVYVGDPWFMANLNEAAYENSEFRYYDRLLGLTCCLYLPVVMHEPSQANRPMGGVIMAASTRPWGLQPKDAGVSEAVRTARKAVKAASEPAARANAVKEGDRSVAKAIAGNLKLARPLADDGPHHDMDDFLRCIAAVHSERTADRWRIRRALHPASPNAVVRLLRDRNIKFRKQRENVIEEISRRLDQREPDTISWFRGMQKEGIERYLPPHPEQAAPDLSIDQCRNILREYLGLWLWRDLKLKLRDGGTSNEDRKTYEEHLKAHPARFLNDTVVDNWMAQRSNARRPSEQAGRKYSASGDIRAFQIDTLDDLIDDLRDSDGPIFEMLVDFLNYHGPISQYVQDILGIQALLDVRDHHPFSDDLAHTVQVYLLGLWFMFTKDCKGRTLAKDAAVNISRFFRPDGERLAEIDHLQCRLRKSDLPDLGLIRKRPLEAGNVPDDAIDDLALWWGISATMHDIGVPVQRFDEWARQFFQRYFDQGAIRRIGSAGGELAKLLMHPRFPVYKSAIVGLHRDRHIRDWLDALFCRQLTDVINHSFAGALILANELEPDGSYSVGAGSPPLWCRIPERLERIYGTVGTEHGSKLEQELIVPAYLAHSIALSNGVECGLSDDAYDRQRRRYFEDIGAHFHVDFEEFPLTWLLALCDRLATPSADLASRYADLSSCLELKEARSWVDEVGASPFFVRRIEEGPEPKSLKLTLEPWEVSAARFSSSDQPSVDATAVEFLAREWLRTIGEPLSRCRPGTVQVRWLVYPDAHYPHLLPPARNVTTPSGDDEEIRLQEVWVKKTEDYANLKRERSCVQILYKEGLRLTEKALSSQVTREYHVRRSAFDIMHAQCRLASLEDVYVNTDWAVEIHFSNVDQPAEPLVRIGRQKIPRWDAWQKTYVQAGERLWPIDPTLPLCASYVDWLNEHRASIPFVLDLGCGDGKNLAYLIANNFKVVGVDASGSALEQCERYLGAPHDKDRLRRMDVRALELGDGFARTAICIDVLGHQPDPDRTLAELHRVLGRGGVACVSLFDLDDEVRQIPETSQARMHEIGPMEYHYYPDPEGERDRYYFFRFYSQADAAALLEKANFRILKNDRQQWTEPPHAGYRHDEHKHSSWFLMVEKIG